MATNETQEKMEIWAPQLFSADDVIEEETPEAEEEVTEAPEEEIPEIEVEGKSTEVKTEKDDKSELMREIQSLKSELLSLTSRKEPKEEPKKDEGEKLTRGQLVEILKAHKDDPEVLLNVIDHMAEQKALSTRDDTVRDINYRQWASNLSGVSNEILTKDEDGYLAANPKVKDQLSEYATNIGLSDHPVGRLAAYAIIRLSEAIKSKQELKPDSAPVKPTSTSTRVMDKTRTPSSTTKTHGLTQEQLKAAQRFGVKPETYAKFIKK